VSGAKGTEKIKVAGIIPARLGSTRLAQKVLRPLNGKPMIYHVWKRASEARTLDEVWIACDDARIESCVKDFGGKAIMTRKDHPNGTSRLAEAVQKTDAEVVVNIQGDEPLIDPRNIDLVAEAFAKHPETQVVTLGVRKTDREEYENPNVVKVVCNTLGNALYFSRSPLPYFRGDETPFSYLKHLGIYGYRRAFLLDFVTWKPSVLEETEKLEQLRILDRGLPLRVVESPHDSFSVDTEEDVAVVESRLRAMS
jgi:3-deoxy-manno-octulosonate cytidylyltransferase (CMP-KDO synthetase)